MDITGIVAIISVFGVIPLIVFLVHRHRERKALIEKGINLDSFVGTKRRDISENLKYGLILSGLAIGIFLGNILAAYTSLNEEVSYFSMIFLFGGLAFLLFYFIAKQKKQQE